MLQQFHNMSSWRKETVTISPHEVETLDFLDTNPNMFYIINPNIAILKVGIGSLPRKNSFEFKIEPNTSEIVGRPEGSTKLYILNDSSVEINITVFSVNREFDPSILKNTTVVIDGYEIETGSEIRGIAEGVVLPTEDKNSSLLLTALQDILTKLGSGIKEYNSTNILNQLGSLMSENTNLNTLLRKLNTIAENTSQIQITAENVTQAAYKDDKLLAIIQGENYSEDVYLNNGIEFNYENTSETDKVVVKFKWLFNDGSISHLYIGERDVLTIFENERLSDFEIIVPPLSTLHLVSDTPLFRMCYCTRVKEVEVEDEVL